jgi:Fe-S cluster biosynthesis and repair protein YggX
MDQAGFEQASKEAARIWSQEQEIKAAKKSLNEKQKALKEARETIENELLKPFMDQKSIERASVSGTTIQFVRWHKVKQVTPNAKTLLVVSKFPGIDEDALNRFVLKKLGVENKDGVRWRNLKPKKPDEKKK